MLHQSGNAMHVNAVGSVLMPIFLTTPRIPEPDVQIPLSLPSEPGDSDEAPGHEHEPDHERKAPQALTLSLKRGLPQPQGAGSENGSDGVGDFMATYLKRVRQHAAAQS
eukprot:5197353-Alexandrium_andersonii.AAC.1